ncbi:MAG: hypothetical protein OXC26_15635 [Albidovulum sp.]|nr:hypothetical protein [Albidovulum sp.]
MRATGRMDGARREDDNLGREPMNKADIAGRIVGQSGSGTSAIHHRRGGGCSGC